MRHDKELADLARRQRRALRGLPQHALDPSGESLESAHEGARGLYHRVGNRAALRMVGGLGTDEASRAPFLPADGLGNRCVAEIMRRHAGAEAAVRRPRFADSELSRSVLFQPKLRVSQPNDPLEIEADRVAELVVAGQHVDALDRIASLGSRGNCSAKQETEEYLDVAQRTTGVEPDECQEGHGHGFIPTADAPLSTSDGSGRQLAPVTRSILESRMGVDLGNVRVHVGPEASLAASRFNARAFTHKNHIWLGQGESRHDLRLMAHEAVHVVQQGAAVQRRARCGGRQSFVTVRDTQASVFRKSSNDVDQGDARIKLPHIAEMKKRQARACAKEIKRELDKNYDTLIKASWNAFCKGLFIPIDLILYKYIKEQETLSKSESAWVTRFLSQESLERLAAVLRRVNENQPNLGTRLSKCLRVLPEYVGRFIYRIEPRIKKNTEAVFHATDNIVEKIESYIKAKAFPKAESEKVGSSSVQRQSKKAAREAGEWAIEKTSEKAKKSLRRGVGKLIKRAAKKIKTKKDYKGQAGTIPFCVFGGHVTVSYLGRQGTNYGKEKWTEEYDFYGIGLSTGNIAFPSREARFNNYWGPRDFASYASLTKLTILNAESGVLTLYGSDKVREKNMVFGKDGILKGGAKQPISMSYVFGGLTRYEFVKKKTDPPPPPEAQITRPQPGYDMETESKLTVCFNTNSSEPTKKEKNRIAKFVEDYMHVFAHNHYKLTIRGRASRLGTYDRNMNLAWLRANTVDAIIESILRDNKISDYPNRREIFGIPNTDTKYAKNDNSQAFRAAYIHLKGRCGIENRAWRN